MSQYLIPPHGGLEEPVSRTVASEQSAEFLANAKKLAAVPVSVFCDDPAATASLVRFAFCKQEPVLEEACRRLAAFTA